MRGKKLRFLSVALCLLPTLAGVLLWDALPARIATHFDFSGTADGWASKGYAVFFLPAMIAALAALCLWGISCDKTAHRQSHALQTFVLWFMPVLSCFLMALIYLAALGYALRVDLCVAAMLGVVFLVVGNYLPKCRRNHTMGIRIKWTLQSEENWNYTHRLGGFCFVVCGLVTLAGAALGLSWLLFPAVLLAVGLPIIASYRYYRKKEK